MEENLSPSPPARSSSVKGLVIFALVCFVIGVAAMGWLVAEWTPARIAREAERVGSATAGLCAAIMRAKPHPEQGFRACLGILRLAKSYGGERLEAACRRGLDIGATTYGSIASILKSGLDRAYREEGAVEPSPIDHTNIRGGGYYH